MTAQDQPVVFVSLTGDEAIKLYDLDPQSGNLDLRATSPAHGPIGRALFTSVAPRALRRPCRGLNPRQLPPRYRIGRVDPDQQGGYRPRHPRSPHYRPRRSAFSSPLITPAAASQSTA